MTLRRSRKPEINRGEVPEEFVEDPVLKWAEEISESSSLKDQEAFELFLKMKEHYVALLKRFSMVARMSDRYQAQLKESNVTLNIAARRDYLTDLSNRRDILELLETELHRAQRHAYPLSVLLCDIDNFKQVNDTHGHEAGDKVLTAVAATLVEAMRAEDHCGRWGGEEFMIILPHTAIEDAASVAWKLNKKVRDIVVEYGAQRLSVTLSLGAAAMKEGEGVDALIKAADTAMLQSKRDGKDSVRVAARNDR